MLSMSMAGQCRMALWLEHHAATLGIVKEPVLPGRQRTFDMGHIIETLFFEKVPFQGREGPEMAGGWWDEIDEVEDHVRGWKLFPSKWPVRERQKELSIGPLKGHIDGTITADGAAVRSLGPVSTEDEPEYWIVDVKSANGYSWDRATFKDLNADPFLGEYVKSQNLYVAAYREQEKVDVSGSCLVFFNKEQSKISCRYMPYDEAMAAEALERLTTGAQDVEPMPDWEWVSGGTLPLRCSYCDFKQPCADVRGMKLEGPTFTRRGKPEWRTL